MVDIDDWAPENEVPTKTTEIMPVFKRQTESFAELEQIHGPGAPAVYSLESETVVVGRALDADIRVNSLQVSRKHMSLTLVAGEHRCEDLESRNGVYLNGIRMHSAILRQGDNIQVGDVVFIYHERR